MRSAYSRGNCIQKSRRFPAIELSESADVSGVSLVTFTDLGAVNSHHKSPPVAAGERNERSRGKGPEGKCVWRGAVGNSVEGFLGRREQNLRIPGAWVFAETFSQNSFFGGTRSSCKPSSAPVSVFRWAALLPPGILRKYGRRGWLPAAERYTSSLLSGTIATSHMSQ